MKRLTALLLCLLLAFSLCACAKNAKTSGDSDDSEVAETEEPKENEIILESIPEGSTVVEGTEKPENGVVCIEDPCEEHDSLEEINKIVGGNLVGPAVMGVTDNVYLTIDCDDYVIAEYQFKVNGLAYSFRCAKTAVDISGVYIDANPAFADGTASKMQFNSDDDNKCARWFDGNMQYVLTANDTNGALDMDTFKSIAQELKQLSADKM